jgi:tetratricopeptide (TPR) repeat protein
VRRVTFWLRTSTLPTTPPKSLPAWPSIGFRELATAMKPKGRAKSTKLSPAAQKTKKNEKDTIKSLCSRARASLEEGEVQKAHDLASRACTVLPRDSNNVHPIELLGEINIELGELEQARECFLEAVRRREGVPAENLQPGEEGKFLWLGQLSCGEDAEKWYTMGVECLLRLRDVTAEDDKRKYLDEKICQVYCSLIELYLTDLW